MKLVSQGMVEKVKHSFRLSQKCLAEGKEKPSSKNETQREGAVTPVKKEAKACRSTPSGSGRKPAASRGAAGGRGEAAESSKRNRIKTALEGATRKRNDFLSERRAFLLPFMQEGDNFFTRMDRALLEHRQLEKEKREKAAESSATELEAEKNLKVELANSRHPARLGHRVAGGGDGRAGTVAESGAPPPEEEHPPPLPPPPLPPTPREGNPMDDVDLKAIPADPMTVAETLVKMGVLKRQDVAPGAAKVALTGQRCTEWPPLQVNPNNGVPTMEDMVTLGARIEQRGPFHNYFITWPGSRVPVDDPKELSQLAVDLSFDHVYYLEKRESYAPRSEPILGPNGWTYPPPPVPRVVGRTTALRLRSGEFVQHRSAFMKRTQSYAKRSNVPVDNLVTFSIINPHTQRRYNVTREFCAAPFYANIYKRLLKDTLRKNPSLAPILSRQVPSAPRTATNAVAAGDPARASHGGRGGGDGIGDRGRDAPRTSNAASPWESLPPAAETGAGNGFHRRVPGSLSLPRGPGGIDILSCPTSPAKESPDEGGGGTARSHVRSVSSADAVAAAAMLGLGAEVFADRGGRVGGEAAVEAAGSASVLVSVAAVMGAGRAGTGAMGGRRVVGAVAAPPQRSNGHVNGVGVEADALGVQHRAVAASEEDASAPDGNGGRDGGGGVTSDRQVGGTNGGGTSVAGATQRRGEVRESGGEGGAVAEEAVKEEGTNPERFKGEAEGTAAGTPTVDFDPSDVLKGVPAVDVPEAIEGSLQAFQKEGLSWMVHMYQNGMPLILGDEPGLGKSLQSIALIAYLQYSLGKSGPVLVVVPSTALGNWMAEMAKFCPSLRTIRFHGSKEERTRIKEEEMKELSESNESKVVLTTHEAFSSEGSFFKKRSLLWQLVVVDEGSQHGHLKKDKSQLTQKLKQVNTMCRALLSSTPPQSTNLRELWATLHLLVPDVFTADTADRFEEGIDVAAGTCDPRRMEQANDLISVFMLRRAKSQVKLDLPPKQEVELLVKLSPAQHLVYRHLLVNQDREMADAIRVEAQKYAGVRVRAGGRVAGGGGGDGDGGIPSPVREAAAAGERDGGAADVNGGGGEDGAAVAKRDDELYQKLMDLLLQLRKACNHPHMLLDVERDGGETAAQAVDSVVAASGKLTLLDRMLPRLQEHGHRCLICSQFASMLDILQDLCLARGYEYARLDEFTSSVHKRLETRRFNAPKSKVFVVLVSTRMGAAGSVNLDLTAADTVILYDSDWNPQVDLEAIERAHRIGQTKPVNVYRLVCRCSVEERMIAERKRRHGDGGGSKIESKEACFERSGAEESEQALQLRPSAALAPEDLGDSMSKGELASLIHEGARAVVAPQEEGDLTDAELDTLIATPAVDAPSSTPSARAGVEEGEGSGSSSPPPSPPNAAMTAAASAVAAALAAAGRVVSPAASSSGRSGGGGKRRGGEERNPSRSSRGLKEADLRQLDGRSGALLGERVHGAIMGKRARKSSIVMVPGDNATGQGKLAVLTDEMEEEDASAKHRCVGCTKTAAASAGGMLFRCQTCAVVYCEDCLPQDEVEPLARNPPLEAHGYFPKHVYWIRCGSCVKGKVPYELGADSRAAAAVEGRRHSGSAPIEGRGERGDDDGDDVGTRGRGGGEAENDSDAEEPEQSESESESDSEPEREPKPEPMPFAVALTLLRDHPAAKAAFLHAREDSATPNSSSSKRPRKGGGASSVDLVDIIARKVEAGRYRSPAAFESDARQMLTQGKGPRSLSSDQKEMLLFFEQDLLPELLRKP